jgi:uncharacterized membrane protein
MAETHHHRSFAADFRRNFLSGLFVLLPIIVTIWLLSYLFNLLSELGSARCGWRRA